jgi:hypothetical protein
MILHVVGGEDFTPEPARDVEHESFFISRILDTDVSPVYSFNGSSRTKDILESIFANTATFEIAAQKLSRDFSLLHLGASRDGAFFIFELTTADPQIRLFSLIKYDYREAIEQALENGGNLLRRIVHAFIADKKAIQKSAIIRLRNGIADAEISTRDRMKPAPAIGGYFETFLDVKRALTDAELNQKAVDALRNTITNCKSILPDQDVPRAFRHAKGILRDRREIDEDAIFEAILAAAGSPEAEDIRSELLAKLQREIRTAKLTGLAFKPDPQIWKKPALRRLKTVEGVTLMYPDAIGLAIARKQTDVGGEVITITTARVTEDVLVRDPAR